MILERREGQEGYFVEAMRFQINDHIVGVSSQSGCFRRVRLDCTGRLEHCAEVGRDGEGALRPGMD